MQHKTTSIILLTVLTCCCCLGGESEHEASVPAGDGVSVHPLLKTRILQEDALLPLLLSQHSAGKKEVFTTGLEHCLWIQRFGL